MNLSRTAQNRKRTVTEFPPAHNHDIIKTSARLPVFGGNHILILGEENFLII